MWKYEFLKNKTPPPPKKNYGKIKGIIKVWTILVFLLRLTPLSLVCNVL